MKIVPSYVTKSKLNRSEIRDISGGIIDEHGLPRVVPASFYASTTPEERALLGHDHGIYLLPTIELAEWLAEHIGGRKAIEIGSGNGRLAERMGIPATDSMIQNETEIVLEHYLPERQPLVRYGPNVEKLEAQEAVRRYRPQVVIGCWVTHRYNPRRHGRGGNQFGPKMDWILSRVEEYVLVGNEKVHARNPLMDLPHEKHYPDFLYSRAQNGSPDFIGVWKGSPR